MSLVAKLPTNAATVVGAVVFAAADTAVAESGSSYRGMLVINIVLHGSCRSSLVEKSCKFKSMISSSGCASCEIAIGDVKFRLKLNEFEVNEPIFQFHSYPPNSDESKSMKI